MYDPDATFRLIRENARRLAEDHSRLREAAAMRSQNSRTGLLAQYLRTLADHIDPSGEIRRTPPGHA